MANEFSTYGSVTPVIYANTGPAQVDDPAVKSAKDIKAKLASYFAAMKTPAVPQELEQSLEMRKQAQGGYFSPAGQQALAPALANAANAETQRKAQLASVMAKNQVAGSGMDRMQSRLSRQMQQAQAGRLQQMGIQNIPLSDQLSKAYETGILRNQGLRDQRTFMKLATDMAAEQMGLSGLLETRGAEEARVYLDAMRNHY